MSRPGGTAGRHSRLAAGSLLALSALAIQLVIAIPSAHAFTSCSFDSGVETATSTSTEIDIEVDGSTIEVEGVACGTVTTVNTFIVDLNSAENVTLAFDLAGGPFAPGATSEPDGSSEIEFTVREVGEFIRVRVIGTEGADSIAFGDRTLISGTVTEVNLNAAVDGITPDRDISIETQASRLVAFGQGGADTLTGAGLGTSMSHSTGAAMDLFDGDGPDTLTGGSNNDFFATDDTASADVFSGGDDGDFIDFQHAPVGITVSLNNKPDDGAACPGPSCEGDNVKGDIESIAGTAFNDNFTGNGGSNSFDPSGGVNTAFGGGGDDFLFEGGGKDDFSGGKGFDLMSYQRDDLGVDVTLDGLPNDGPPGNHDNIRPDVEGVDGGQGGDRLVGNAGPNFLRGGTGGDTVNGGAGNDTLQDGNSSATPNGSDTLIGGPGVDIADYQFSNGNLTLSLDGKRNDTSVGGGSVGIDNIHADVENVLGGLGNDHITGNPKANRLVGADGNDTLAGLGGNDVLLPGAGEDDVKGGPGRDVASFLDAAAAITADLLAGSASGDGPDSLGGVERLIGSLFGDHLVGSLGANRLDGRAGDDVLKGLAGKDLLLGGPGNDNLDGGAESDTCKQGPGSGSVTHCEA